MVQAPMPVLCGSTCLPGGANITALVAACTHAVSMSGDTLEEALRHAQLLGVWGGTLSLHPECSRARSAAHCT